MLVGVVGKPNAGKSTFFSSATLAPAEIAPYPFTTIEPNRGIAYVTHPCPHVELGADCSPNNAPCFEGTRLVPVDLLDVAGLVPEAHKGRGLGNKFLDDLRQADAFIHVVDASGGTDLEGNIVAQGEHDPREDVRFLEDELSHWIAGILSRNWDRIARRVEVEGLNLEKLLTEKLAGLGLREAQVHAALRSTPLGERPSLWKDEDFLGLARELRRAGKPMILAGNKADVAPKEVLKSLMGLEGYEVVPTCSECELALRRAAKGGLVSYLPGEETFETSDEAALTEAQRKALLRIRSHLEEFGTTGVQGCLEGLVFRVLDMLVAFPVEDETHWTDKDGNVLPDAYLLPKGSVARDLAYKVHTDLGDNFIRAINARTKRVVGHDYVIQDGDVIKIVSRA